MQTNPTRIYATLALFVFAMGMLADAKLAEGDFGPLLQSGSFTSPAAAIVGRPLTPVSVAGVARRTTRRVVRRSTIYIAALPPGCATLLINSVNSWHCGATYYQMSGPQYVVIYVDD